MAPPAQIKVTGLRELLRATARSEKEVKKQVRERFKKVGEVVRREAQSRFSPVDAESAGGYRVFVRQRGVGVEQRKRKTTGKRADYGALQMKRALIPAADAKKQEIEREFEAALEDVVDIFESIAK